MKKVNLILFFIFQKICLADLKGLTTVNTTFRKWEQAEKELSQFFSDSIAKTVKNEDEVGYVNPDILDQKHCTDSFEKSHFPHTHDKLPCSPRPGLAWVRLPPNVGAGRPGRLSHWSPVQVEATRCGGACQVNHVLTKLHQIQM